MSRRIRLHGTLVTAAMKNYVAPPNHYSNQKLQDVWIAED